MGDTIHVIGHLTDFTETIGSMQIEHDQVTVVKPGDWSASRWWARPAHGDDVYRVLPG